MKSQHQKRNCGHGWTTVFSTLSVLLVDNERAKDEAEHPCPKGFPGALAMRGTKLCLYFYDPLDRLVRMSPEAVAESQSFYCKNRIATEIQGQLKHSIFQYDDQLLAQRQSDGTRVDSALLAPDRQRSVLHTVSPGLSRPIAYSAYGFRSAENGLLSLMGFNGERRDAVTGRYMLGNGYRAFNPVLMRFDIPDSWSPFGKGGFNPYAYCLGDPVNRRDPNGHVSFWDRLIQFAGRTPAGRGRAVSRLTGSISPGGRTSSNPGVGTVSRPAMTQEPITTSFTYHAGFGIENRSGLTGSLDSIASSRSTRSSTSSASFGSRQSFPSSSSISSSSSDSSTDTAPSLSIGPVATDWNWSGSGRRNVTGWGPTETLRSVPTYVSDSTPRITFEDTQLPLDSQGNTSYRPDPFVAGHAWQIRRASI